MPVTPVQRRSAPRHAASVMSSLDALKTGRVASKTQACEMAGIGVTALTPARLAPLIAKSPEFRALTGPKGAMLDMVVDHGGVMVSLRETLAGCAESAARALHDAGRRADTDLTPSEARKIARAKMLIDLCKSAGLWSDDGPDAVGIQLQAELRQRETAALSVDSLLADHRRRDQISPTLRKLHALPDSTSDTDSSEPSAGGGSDAR